MEEQRFLKGLAAKLVLKGFREGDVGAYSPTLVPIDAGVRDIEIPKLVLIRSADDYLRVGLKLEIRKIFVEKKRGIPHDPKPGKYWVSFYVYPQQSPSQKFDLNGMFDLKEIEQKVLDHFSQLERRFRK